MYHCPIKCNFLLAAAWVSWAFWYKSHYEMSVKWLFSALHQI